MVFVFFWGRKVKEEAKCNMPEAKSWSGLWQKNYERIIMNTLEAISQRRSIRRFKDTPVPDEMIVKIINSAIQAPSGKNRQPWRFVVVKEDKRPEMIRIMRESIAKIKEQGGDTGSSEWTSNAMEKAPVTIFIFNPYAENTPGEGHTSNVVDVQSVGAAIQNMLLSAQELGIGSLWICDVFYAYNKLCEWLGEKHEMIAAVSLGYPDEQPNGRPRKLVNEVTRWF